MDDVHPIIAQFQALAETLDASGRQTSLDDAIVDLASWMGLAQHRLGADDLVVLAGIGAMMYREGLRRRAGG